jgi:hypothetical protein
MVRTREYDVDMDLLSGTLLRLSSVKSGMMMGMVRVEEREMEEKGGCVEEGVEG